MRFVSGEKIRTNFGVQFSKDKFPKHSTDVLTQTHQVSSVRTSMIPMIISTNDNSFLSTEGLSSGIPLRLPLLVSGGLSSINVDGCKLEDKTTDQITFGGLASVKHR